jgi:hypothetical protein
VAERDRAAQRVEFVFVGAGFGQPGQRHRRERLVDLEHADLVEPDTGLVQRLLGGGDRTGQHQHRVGPGDRAGAVADDRRQPHRDGVVGRHDQQCRRAIRDLRRVACVDDAVLSECRLQTGELLDGGTPADALVGHHWLAVGEHRHDLRLERAVVLRLGCQLMRARRVLVETGPRKAPLLRDELRRDALIEREISVAGKHFRPVRHACGPR